MDRERIVYLNGEIVPESEAKVSIRDRGFVYGDAVFDTTRTFGGKIFKLKEHLDRLYDSLKYMRIDPGMSPRQVAELTMQVLDANLPLLNEDDDYWVTQRFTRGVPTGPGLPRPTVIIECTPLPFEARAQYYRDGLPVITPSVKRTPPEAMSPRAKMHNYINTVLADLEVKGQNPEAWPMMLDFNGNIAEGPGSNFFFVKDGAVITPKGAVRSRGNQPPDGPRSGPRAVHRDQGGGHRPVRRLYRRRGIRDLHQLLHLPYIDDKRRGARRRRRPGASHGPAAEGLQRPCWHRRRPTVPRSTDRALHSIDR